MGLLKKQRESIIGMILGDAYLQPTGKRNARLRLEHSTKQKDYIFWKYELLKNFMQSKPKLYKRYNPRWKKEYYYYRCQTHSSPIFGRLRKRFYQNSRKTIPENIEVLLKSPLTLAIWVMDDGYLYKRDKHLFIYLPPYTEEEISRLREALKKNFGLESKYGEKKKGKERFLWFDKRNTQHLIEIIKPHLIPSFKEKLLLTP